MNLFLQCIVQSFYTGNLKIDDTLMPQESFINRKSNPSNSPLLKSFAVGKMNKAELNPPPASTSARPELRAENFKNFKIFGGKKPPNRPANHISDRNINLAETDVIGQRQGASNQTKNKL